MSTYDGSIPLFETKKIPTALQAARSTALSSPMETKDKALVQAISSQDGWVQPLMATWFMVISQAQNWNLTSIECWILNAINQHNVV